MLLKGDVAEEVAKLKQEDGDDIHVGKEIACEF